MIIPSNGMHIDANTYKNSLFRPFLFSPVLCYEQLCRPIRFLPPVSECLSSPFVALWTVQR